MILDGNKILTSIKGPNSFKNMQKIMSKNPDLDLDNIDVTVQSRARTNCQKQEVIRLPSYINWNLIIDVNTKFG